MAATSPPCSTTQALRQEKLPSSRAARSAPTASHRPLSPAACCHCHFGMPSPAMLINAARCSASSRCAGRILINGSSDCGSLSVLTGRSSSRWRNLVASCLLPTRATQGGGAALDNFTQLARGRAGVVAVGVDQVDLGETFLPLTHRQHLLAAVLQFITNLVLRIPSKA